MIRANRSTNHQRNHPRMLDKTPLSPKPARIMVNRQQIHARRTRYRRATVLILSQLAIRLTRALGENHHENPLFKPPRSLFNHRFECRDFLRAINHNRRQQRQPPAKNRNPQQGFFKHPSLMRENRLQRQSLPS